MTEFKFKWKKGWFWNTRTVIGFGHDVATDKLTLYFKDGSIHEIAKWAEYDCFLGKDYHAFTQAQIRARVDPLASVK